MSQPKTNVVVYRLHHPELPNFSYIGSSSTSENPNFLKTSIVSQHRHAIKKGEDRKEWFVLYENGLNPKELVLEVLEKCLKKDLYETKQKYYKQFYPAVANVPAPVNEPSTEISIVEPHQPQSLSEVVCVCDEKSRKIEELEKQNEELKKQNEELKKQNETQRKVIEDRWERVKQLKEENDILQKFRDEGFNKVAFIAQMKYLISKYE